MEALKRLQGSAENSRSSNDRKAVDRLLRKMRSEYARCCTCVYIDTHYVVAPCKRDVWWPPNETQGAYTRSPKFAIGHFKLWTGRGRNQEFFQIP